jgi:hypothetical protein
MAKVIWSPCSLDDIDSITLNIKFFPKTGHGSARHRKLTFLHLRLSYFSPQVIL